MHKRLRGKASAAVKTLRGVQLSICMLSMAKARVGLGQRRGMLA